MSTKYDRRNFVKLASGNIPEKQQAVTKSDQGSQKNIRLGFIGIGGRGSYHLNCALGIEGVEVPAICELKPVRLYQAKRWIEEAGLPSPTMYDRGPQDYLRMIETENLDAVICCTPWEYHASVCIAAMKNSKHAVSEVPLCITLDEAWEIVETHEKTGKWATIGLEGLGDMTLLNMIRKGLFGQIVHAQTGYIHDLRMVKFTPNEEPWRLQHSIERNGNLYPDHPMARMLPVLDVNHGDRFEYIQSMSTNSVMLRNYAELNYGKKSPYSGTKYSLGDYNASLVRTVNGKIMTIIHDTSTPHPRENFRMQGTKGIYYSEDRRIYLEGISPQEHTWEPAEKYFKQYAVPRPVVPPRKGGKIEGHGGGASETPYTWHRLILALRENRLPDWDVYDSVTSGAIVPLSCESVANKSKAVDFPDFTKGKWKERPIIMPIS
ncbi:MAG TPA: Gfo/Idh/MocA family oxidoreductase [Bacteroidales bacterium]|jgi:predicted dehydrogenase|nr:Gfo/Idh/MocA family oxidoreductase [Bacteroidales bacterium]